MNNIVEEQVERAIEKLRPKIVRGGVKRERILEAALELIERFGYKKITVDEIAREAQVAKGTVYVYFRDKEDIIVNIFYEKIANLFTDVSRNMRAHPDVPSKLVAAIRTAIDYHIKDETVNRILARDILFLGPLIIKEVVRFEAFVVDFIGSLLKLGIEEGSIRPDIDVEAAARMIMRFNQANIVRIKTGEQVDLDAYIETFRKMVFEGIGSKRRRRR